MNVEKKFVELRELLTQRRNESAKWLEKNAPEMVVEEKHLTKDITPERVYWRYGYYSACIDILSKMEAS